MHRKMKIKTMKKQGWFYKIGLVSFSLCLTLLGEAKVKLPALFSDGMVLQREQAVKVWGKADPGEEVKVVFLKKKVTTRADSNGDWKLTLPAMKPGGPHEMSINECKLKDILIGDVFLCSGQSNMELPVARVLDLFRTEIETHTNLKIRHVKVPLTYNFHAPQTDIAPVEWKAMSPEHSLSFSALGYFFAKALFAKNNVPIGLINSSVGGSPVEAWMSEESLQSFPQYLNEKRIYESDAYVACVKQTEAERQQLWNTALYSGDRGCQSICPWYADAYDDSDWTEMDLFSTDWGTNGLNPLNGSHWFRRTFELPQAALGKEATLRLGCIVDADSVFVNGTFVGSVAYQYPPRIYAIPAHLLRKGSNQITVRLISYAGRPRFVPDKPYKLLVGHEEVNLCGIWKYKQGCAMPSLPGQTFFQYKPVGLYNTMIAPLLPYRLAGVVWYQGESNVSRYNEYASLLTTLIGDWRDRMQTPQLPFYVVELASFLAPNDPGQAAWAALRSAQALVVNSHTNTTLIANSDLGEWNDIHPLDKKTLGERVADAIDKESTKRTIN